MLSEIITVKRPHQKRSVSSPTSDLRSVPNPSVVPTKTRLHFISLPISKTLQSKLSAYIQLSIFNNLNRLPRRTALIAAPDLVDILHQIDLDLGQRGLVPSILFTTLQQAPHRQKTISSILDLVSLAKPSRIRTDILLGLALNLSRDPYLSPKLLQKTLQILLSAKILTKNEIARYLRKRKFRAQKLAFARQQLVQWIVTSLISPNSSKHHVTHLANLLRSWGVRIPLPVIHSLIWLYIPRSHPTFDALAKRYGRRPLKPPKQLSEGTISMITNTLRHSNPEKVDIQLLDTFIQSLLESNRFLLAIPAFEALHEVKLDLHLDFETLMMFLKKMISTENFENGVIVYSALMRHLFSQFSGQQAPHVLDSKMQQFHISFLQEETQIVLDLIHGLRTSSATHDFITTLLNFIPSPMFVENDSIAQEVLRYAGHWKILPLIQKVLDALNHPLYSNTVTTPSPNRHTFPPETWSAILSAHIDLGHINPSRLILQSMQRAGLSPRREDTSVIAAGVAQTNLEAGYDLACKLCESMNVNAYETILEIALERGNTDIVEWAKGLVAYERTTEEWIRPASIEEEVLSPEVFEMTSMLSDAMNKAEIPTRTTRAVGAIITHVARTQGLAEALKVLRSEKIRFGRDLYDTLYGIAWVNEDIDCAIWLAYQMRRRGWMPRSYTALQERARKEE